LIEAVGPEPLVAVEPFVGFVHRLCAQPAGNRAAAFTNPAFDSTSRCLITAGSDIENGSASALTERLSAWLSRATMARRVGSASAAKVRSSGAGL
jgi:hypothetical protein